MEHCVQAIVTTSEVDHELQAVSPEPLRVTALQGFVILPVSADFLESSTESRPEQSTETFMLLTAGFEDLLRQRSRLGPLANIETDYFGGQGAAVYSRGDVVMEPEWGRSGPINQALGLIGVKRHVLRDRFRALGLHDYRSNDQLIEAAARRKNDVRLATPRVRLEAASSWASHSARPTLRVR